MDELSSMLSSLSLAEIYGLDKLPYDIYHFHLFKYLDIDDILELRLVSRRFRSIVCSYDIKEIAFLENFGKKHNWFSTIKSTDLKSQIAISKLNLLKKLCNNFTNLKFLRIQKAEFNSQSIIRVEYLNKFTKLQILEIKKLDLHSNDTLYLPNLKALSVAFESACYLKEPASLILDTPNLKSLDIHQLRQANLIDNLIKIKYPLFIKFLKQNRYDRNSILLKNLECLELDSLESKVEELMKLKRLKKIKAKACALTVRELDELLETKNDILIVIGGVKTEKIDYNFNLDDFETLEYRLKNYDKLDNDINYTNFIDYNQLIQQLPTKPVDLFSKFTCIQMIEIKSEIEKEDRLIRFIRDCPNLYRLIIRTALSQQFYEDLPLNSSLSSLYQCKNTAINFKFIVHMPYLTKVHLEQAIEIDGDLNLENLKYLKELRFQIKPNNRITIFKKGKNKYYVDICKWLNKVINDNEDFTFSDLSAWSRKLIDNLNDLFSIKTKLEERLDRSNR